MKMFVCSNCGNAIERLGYPGSFNRHGQNQCGGCGSELREREVTPEEQQMLNAKHSKWSFRTVLGFEAIFWSIVIFFVIIGALAKMSHH